ncbi:ribonuclease Oy-like protein [Leptotrombidium deliense]|uniref:Ribonuclease Oy-like protein n=1 Tax=Leptotrombidium deliense TaxID=299467 RepID=A0A443S729_9ACAR|nr:ribonuclease Oy-like protein [Leptotrombidium deliense]
MIVALFLFMPFQSETSEIVDSDLCPSVSPFNYIALSLTWTPGFCFQNEKCINLPVNRWTIHGTWPSNYAAPSPSYCCIAPDAEERVIQKFSHQLNKYWKGMGRSNTEFWNYEWNKHGTCGYGSRKLFGQLNYFQSTLLLFHAIDLDSSLSRKLILPHKFGLLSVYSLEHIRASLMSEYGKRVKFGCRNVQMHISGTSNFLKEIIFCFDKHKLRQINCVGKDFKCDGKFVHYVKY